jgi:hypothetical protein
MHQRRASRSVDEGTECDREGQIDAESEKSTSHEESHISKCQSLLNQNIN